VAGQPARKIGSDKKGTDAPSRSGQPRRHAHGPSSSWRKISPLNADQWKKFFAGIVADFKDRPKEVKEVSFKEAMLVGNLSQKLSRTWAWGGGWKYPQGTDLPAGAL